MKKSSLTARSPDNVETHAKKAHVRESAEIIVVRAPTHEGPNVKVMRIAVSKDVRIRNRGTFRKSRNVSLWGMKGGKTIFVNFASRKKCNKYDSDKKKRKIALI